nr:(-)-germacrene D synthase-like [Ipomoea batatas]
MALNNGLRSCTSKLLTSTESLLPMSDEASEAEDHTRCAICIQHWCCSSSLGCHLPAKDCFNIDVALLLFAITALPPNQTPMDEVTRRSANFHPSIWGEYFLTYASQPMEVDTEDWLEHQKLKEEIKKMLVDAPDTSSQKLEFINNIQRLGVSYQFENEIDASLEYIFKAYDDFNDGKDENDLYVVSLRFRLLRQNGYHVSASVLEKFKDCNGKFKESLINNVQAMLSLYEASHLRVHDEQILEEALIFTTSHLESMLPHLSNALRSQMTKLVGAYYDEAKWYNNGSSPTFEEYMKVALVTSGYTMLATTSLVGMQEDFLTKEVFDWMISGPLIVRASEIVGRLMDDITGYEFEQQRGHFESSVQIFMKEYGKSKEETTTELQEQVINAWKDINQECLKPTVFPMPILTRILNLTRVIDLLYHDGDLYTHSETKLKHIITSTLVNPIP